MKRLFLLLTLVIFSVQFLTCNPTNPWENSDSKDITSVEAVNNTQVKIVFSANVEESSAETIANYSIAGLTVNSAVRDSSDNKIVLLTTTSQANVEYTLIINGVKTVVNGNVKSKIINTTNNPDKFTGDGPFVVIGVARNSSTSITINFSKDVDTASGCNAVNYIINPTLGTTSISVSGNSVALGTDVQIDDVEYTVTVNSVQDLNKRDTIASPNNKGTFGSISYPYLVSTTSYPNRIVDLFFSEDIDISGATFSINNGLAVISSSLLADLQTVRIITDYQVDSFPYIITVSGVTDTHYNAMNPTPATAPFTGDACPTFESVALDGTAMLLVYFSENMLDDTSVYSPNNKINYILLDVTLGGTDVTAIYINDAYLDGTTNKSKLHISLKTSLCIGHTYELQVNDRVQDAKGNSLRAPNAREFPGPSI